MATDEELFREWQSGKAGALATLVAHLYRLLDDAHLAEDLAQETFSGWCAMFAPITTLTRFYPGSTASRATWCAGYLRYLSVI
jgi:hypothetical protein